MLDIWIIQAKPTSFWLPEGAVMCSGVKGFAVIVSSRIIVAISNGTEDYGLRFILFY
jgi:hypothetical protein